MTKLYDDLIKPLGMKKQGVSIDKKNYVQASSEAETSHGVCIDGENGLNGMNLSFTWEYHDGLGEWYGDKTPHVHPYPEVQFFVGLDTANVNYLGADIECCLGSERQTFAFSEPTVVVVPAGVPHGPVITKRMYSPKGIGYYSAALSATVQTETFGVNGKTDFARLVKPLKDNIVIRRSELKTSGGYGDSSGMKLGPGNADHLAWMHGEDLEGLDVNMDWGFFSSPGLWHRNVGAHVHPTDEILVFMGTDPACGDSLGAEIEVDLGKEHERHMITEPSIVICKAGMPHGPFVTHVVDRPFAFFSINLSATTDMTFID